MGKRIKSGDVYCEYLKDPNICDELKIKHIRTILEFKTHNGISKDAILEISRWLYCRQFDDLL